MFKVILLLWCINIAAFAQTKKPTTKLFQFSLTPGVSSNGLHAGGFTNVFSFNATSGYSSATLFLEIGLLSNANEIQTRGLQLAGIANVTGINAYTGLNDKDIDQKYRTGFEANVTGAQISGLINSVLSNVYGAQLTGGVNVVRNALFGFQVAGISNVVYKYSFGLQLAGLSNVSVQSMDGVQIAAFTNYTKGGLYGVQLSIFNEAGFIEGKNGFENTDYTGLQLGLINKAKERMNGYQIGLLNISGRMQGTQIGLINIHKRGKDMGTRDGTAIGLINIGDVGHLAVNASELFPFNIELATGHRKNGRIASEAKNKYILNSLIYSSRGNWLSNRDINWAFGYGLRKYYYNRSVTPGMTEFWFFSYGSSFLHLNAQRKKVAQDLNLLVRPEISVGRKIHPKLGGIYVYAAVSYNTQIEKQSTSEGAENKNKFAFTYWPGASVGVLVH
jgi:hypothetical protein